jgi:hypothetical protein
MHLSWPAELEPVALDELLAGAELCDRTDVKYVVPVTALAALAGALRGTHRVLEHGGRRAFGYETTYFDTPDLRAYREHLQQRRRRFKCRSRDYVDGDLCVFEVKLAAARGRTVKHRMAHPRERRGELTDAALAFVRGCVEHAYGQPPDLRLARTLEVVCTRVTLAAPELGERLTCDFGLVFAAADGVRRAQLAPDTAIVESKSARGRALADRALRELGARPVSGCSKYCLGIAMTAAGVRANPLKPLLRRHFEPA